MIFKSEMVEKILAGDKTMTRRPVKDDLPYKYRVGQECAVQAGRGEPVVARILITDIRRERLGDCRDDDAVAEGFRNVVEFGRYWKGIYGDVDYDLEVWVISFKLEEVINGV